MTLLKKGNKERAIIIDKDKKNNIVEDEKLANYRKKKLARMEKLSRIKIGKKIREAAARAINIQESYGHSEKLDEVMANITDAIRSFRKELGISAIAFGTSVYEMAQLLGTGNNNHDPKNAFILYAATCVLLVNSIAAEKEKRDLSIENAHLGMDVIIADRKVENKEEEEYKEKKLNWSMTPYLRGMNPQPPRQKSK